jgi:hypothetical protein
MPSRRVIALIVAFWLLTASYVAYRDLWPVLFASGPPPVTIDLADEASQSVPFRWSIHFPGQKKPGRLITQMKYNEADDTFSFTNRYTELRYENSSVAVVVPELTSVVRVTRSGDLREQTVDGKLELYLGELKFADASAKIAGTVANGQLRATCDVTAPFPIGNFAKELDAIPVPKGQPLNPLQPVNRLADLRPGRRWVVEESNPLEEIVALIVREKFGFKLPEKTGPLIGAVLSDQQSLDWNGNPVPCWVIEYRRDELKARTWVRAADGKVLKQEAFEKGDKVAIVRDN